MCSALGSQSWSLFDGRTRPKLFEYKIVKQRLKRRTIRIESEGLFPLRIVLFGAIYVM